MKHKILLIEDNEQNRYMLSYLLEKHGYDVLIAEDGEAGVREARRYQPDMILLDMQMPIMDGYAVMVELQRINPPFVLPPVLVVTSHAMPGDEAKIVNAGAAGYAEKPIDTKKLLRQIRDLLNLEKQPSATDDSKPSMENINK